MSLPPWTMGSNHAPRIYQARGGRAGKDEEPWRETHEANASDKGTRQLRGSATDARDGRRRVLYLIFATHETHSVPHVSCSSKSCVGDRCLFDESLFEEPISVPRARLPAETRPIIIEDLRNNDRWLRATNNCDPVAQDRSRNCTRWARSYGPPEIRFNNFYNLCSVVFFVKSLIINFN